MARSKATGAGRASRSARKRARTCSAKDVRTLALALPGVEEGPCYGTPGFRVRKKLFARILPEAEQVVVKCDMDDRELLLRAAPEIYEVTPHYAGYPMILVRLDAISPEALAERLEEAWRREAPKRLVAAHDAES